MKKQRVQPIRLKSPFVPWLCSQLKKDNYRQVMLARELGQEIGILNGRELGILEFG